MLKIIKVYNANSTYIKKFNLKMANKAKNKNISEEKLFSIFEATAKETGKRYFEALILNLSNSLNTYGAWANVYNEDQSKAKSLAFLIDNEFLPDFEYDLKGTPCETVIKNDTLLYIPDNLLEIYPDDPEMKEGMKKPLSYLGVPIKDTDGKIIGNMGVLDSKPMPEKPRDIEIFNLFAERATAELQRIKSDAEMKEREENIGKLLDSTLEAIIELDREMNVNLVNSSAENMFLCPSNHFIGLSFSDFLSKNSINKLSELQIKLDNLPLGKRHLVIENGLDIVRIDGTTLNVEATLSEFYMGNENYFTLILRDVKEGSEVSGLKTNIELERPVLNDKFRDSSCNEEILGNSLLLLKILEDIRKVAPAETTVLVQGETGTGKELIARAIHNQSTRKDAPLIKVNCAAIPSNLIESEFFGHEKGAFTGATSKREGRFSLANGGTIFLDEIGELPLDLQSKLLRVLQEGEFEPLGSSKTFKVDVRVVAATNKNLSEEVNKGNFREDLFYRLNVFPLSVPPLRERGEDIILLADKFAESFSSRLGITTEPIDQQNREKLLSYDWPGNIRELQNVIERAVLTSEKGILNIEIPGSDSVSVKSKELSDAKSKEKILTSSEIQQIEKDNIIKALEATNWKISGDKGAAKLLGIPPTTLTSKIKALGIKRSDTN